MKNGSCIECDKPLFDQNQEINNLLCDKCNEEADEILNEAKRQVTNDKSIS